MDGVADELLISAAKQLRGSARRMFLAEVCEALCNGSPRQAEYRFGWGRETVEKGMEERTETPEERAGRPSSDNRGRKPWEEQHPQLAVDIRLKRIQKGKPLKKTEHTDAIFDNVKSVRSAVADDPLALEISVDTKAKVKLGEYSLGGKQGPTATAMSLRRGIMILPALTSWYRWAFWKSRRGCRRVGMLFKRVL